MKSCLVPYEGLPKLVHLASAVHGDIARQAWRIEGLWGMHLYRYGADLTVEGQPVRIEHGFAGFTPPGALAHYSFEGRSKHLFAHFEISPDQKVLELPFVFSLGTQFNGLWAHMEEGIGLLPANFRRAEVKACDVWLALLDAASTRESHLPGVVREALSIIESHIHEALTVADLSRMVSTSHNHLTRLFRASTGKTVIQTILDSRMARARHLLERSTMPIKEVASQVGIDDLQLFNKTVRRHFGVSPSALRKGAKFA